MPLTHRGGSGARLSPFFFFSNLLIWVSAVIVMGIVSFWISQNNNQGSEIIYIEVVVRNLPHPSAQRARPG